MLLTRYYALVEEVAALSQRGRTRNEGQPLQQEKTSPEAVQEMDPLTLWHQFLDLTGSRRCSRLHSVYPKLPHHWLSERKCLIVECKLMGRQGGRRFTGVARHEGMHLLDTKPFGETYKPLKKKHDNKFVVLCRVPARLIHRPSGRL